MVTGIEYYVMILMYIATPYFCYDVMVCTYDIIITCIITIATGQGGRRLRQRSLQTGTRVGTRRSTRLLQERK